MPYIIDGHNLIAAMPDIELHDAEDELALIEQLRALEQRERRAIYVYFDSGQIGVRNDYRVGRIHVRFCVAPRTADDAIQDQLRSIGKQGPNWVVVSSDREVVAAAARSGARSVTSSAFAKQLRTPLERESPLGKPERPLSREEIEAWEALFRGEGGEI
jgi:predicted RNA-binding protein with PIN domain